MTVASIALAALGRVFSVRDGAIVFIARTSALLWASNLLLLPLLITIKYLLDGGRQTLETPEESLVGILIIAPLVENICFIGVIEFLKIFEWRNRTMVLCVAALSGVVHLITGGFRAFTGAIAFAIMSFSYLLWNESPFPKRYAITVLQHVLMNAPPAFLLLMLD